MVWNLVWEGDFSLDALLHELRAVLLEELADRVVFPFLDMVLVNQSWIQSVLDSGGVHTSTKVAAAICKYMLFVLNQHCVLPI